MTTTDTDQADRQARRDALLHLTRRMLSGALLPSERDLLATHVEEALRDGDQAREQLAARSGTRTASDVLVQHDVTRKAMCDALDVGYHLNWQQLIDTAQRHHDANAEWQAEAEQHRHALAAALYCPEDIQWSRLIRAAEQTAAGRRTWRDKAHEMEADAIQARQREAEAVRAREAAEKRATETDAERRRVLRLLSKTEQQLIAVRKDAAAARIRSGRHVAEARRNRDAWRNARRRARELATLYDVRQQEANGWHARAEAAEHAMESTAADALAHGGCHRKLMAQCQRAEQAEASLLAADTGIGELRTEHEKRRTALAATLKRGPGADWHAVHAAAADYVRRAEEDEERANLHATQLETLRFRFSLALGQATPTSWSELHTLAERVTATLTAVRAAVADAKECGGEDAGCTIDHRDVITDLIDNGPAALGEPQPAETEAEAEHEHGWAPATCRRMNTRTCPPSGRCPGPCARFESDDPTPWEQPAEPVTEPAVATDSTGTIFTLPNGIKPATPAPEIHVHVNVTPGHVADAVRRILREDRATVRDLLR